MTVRPLPVVFYEKPGCRNNARQKALLAAAGHPVEARDLLTWPWTVETLRPFFAGRPVAAWFNRAAPRVASGEVDPAAFDAATALVAMVADPLLIRRPLLETAHGRGAGFEPGRPLERLGIRLPLPEPDLETCSRPDGEACRPPAAP